MRQSLKKQNRHLYKSIGEVSREADQNAESSRDNLGDYNTMPGTPKQMGQELKGDIDLKLKHMEARYSKLKNNHSNESLPIDVGSGLLADD